MSNRKEDFKYCITVSKQIKPKAPVLLDGDFDICAKKAKKWGYDGIELQFSNTIDINVVEIKKSIEDKGLCISGLATGSTYVIHKLSFTDDSIEIRNAAIERINEYTDLASELSASVILGCVRGNLKQNSDLDEYLNRLAESMRKISDHAQSLNVPVVLEAINRYENNFLNTAAETCKFLKDAKLDSVKLLLDTFHMNIEDADIYQSIIECAGYVGYVHIADSNRMYPGAGHIDYRKVFKALKEISYQGFLSAECLPVPNGDIAAEKWIEYVNSLV